MATKNELASAAFGWMWLGVILLNYDGIFLMEPRRWISFITWPATNMGAFLLVYSYAVAHGVWLLVWLELIHKQNGGVK